MGCYCADDPAWNIYKNITYFYLSSFVDHSMWGNVTAEIFQMQLFTKLDNRYDWNDE